MGVTWLDKVELRRGVPAQRVIADDAEGWIGTMRAWIDLPPHPSILMPVDTAGDSLWVRYADLWPVRFVGPSFSALWFLELCEVYRHIATSNVSPNGWLARPVFGLDAERHLRVGFRAPTCAHLPGGLEPSTHLKCEALVYVVGRAAETGWQRGRDELESLVARACGKPKKRPPTLDALTANAMKLIDESHFTDVRLRTPAEEGAWLDFDRARGFEALGDRETAFSNYDRILDRHRRHTHAIRGYARTRPDPLPLPPDPAPRSVEVDVAALQHSASVTKGSPGTANLAWFDAEPQLLAMEAAGGHTTARTAYHAHAKRQPEARLGLARCHLALGVFADAVEAAKQAPQRFEALFVEAAAHRGLNDHSAALACADRLIALAADDADAHYVRGKALFALRRLPEAREALERAFALRPTLLEAMLLRREVDRAMAAVRRDVGAATSSGSLPRVDGPLGEAMSAAGNGFYDAALDILADRDEPDARRLRAHCLAFVGRHADALSMFSTLDDHAAKLGAAAALLALGRLDDALTAYTALLAARPADVDALHGRATTYERLGFPAEAERDHQRATAIALGRGELRAKARS